MTPRITKEDLLGMDFWLYRRWHNVGTRAHWSTHMRFYTLNSEASDHLNDRLKRILEEYLVVDMCHAKS